MLCLAIDRRPVFSLSPLLPLTLVFGLLFLGSLPWPILAQELTVRAGVPQDVRTSPRPTIVAVPAQNAVRLDGILDEPVWQQTRPQSGFLQAEPREGMPATEKTEVWVAYDDERLYLAAFLYDSDPGGIVVNDIRKDFDESSQDVFSVILDTFADGRNGYVFMTNPEGARGDRQVSHEGREINISWDAVWSVETQRTSEGWSVEMAIPFRAIRFDPHSGGKWGVNFSRTVRRKNETTYWAPIPRSFNLMRLSMAGQLTGLPAAAGGRDLRVKPYALVNTVRETGGENFETDTEIGLDVKYGLSRGLTLDLTANPDFAQVEADEQKVNLTQFSVFFQEKREFFLENSGLFYVGDAPRSNRVHLTPTPDEDLLVFFSRRIGLTEDGDPVPIQGGARLTGQKAGMEVGAVVMRTADLGDSPGNEYTVFRVRKNLLSASDVGGIFMMRRDTEDGGDFNRVYGADANLRFPGNVEWSSYLLRTESPGGLDGEYAFRTSINHEGNMLHAKVGLMQLGEGFRDDLGFYRRTGVRKSFADIGLRPRPQWFRELGGREIHPHVAWSYYEDMDGRMVAKRLHTGNSFFFESGSWFEVSVDPMFERIEEPFLIDRRIDPIPVGSYHWHEWTLKGSTDPSRRISLNARGTIGGLWSGTQETIQTTLTLRPTYKLKGILGVQRTAADLDLPDDSFVKTFWTGRMSFSFSRDMFIDALVQYDPSSELYNSNVRFNFIHHPLSDLYIVWNEQRFFTGDGIVPGRSLTLKATQMVSF